MIKFKKYIAILIIFSMLFISPAQSYALFSEMTVQEEYELGQKFNIAMKTQAPLIFDPLVVNYLNKITDKLLLQALPQPFEYEANMMLDPTLNAFAMAGGFVYINSGLFLRMENESELAGVMGHEIAHVTQRHIAKRQAKAAGAMLASVLAAVGAIAVGSMTGATGNSTAGVAIGALSLGQSAMLSYSRDDENEADRVGFEYMTKAGYDPNGYVTAFRKLQNQFSSRSVPVYLSTHPDLNERISGMAARIRSQATSSLMKRHSNDEFLFVQSFVRAQYDNLATVKVFASKLNKELPITQLVLGILKAREHNIPEAKEHYNKLEKLTEENDLYNPFFLREIGRFNYQQADINKAFIFLTKAVELDPKDLMGLFFLARTQNELNMPKAAQENYLKVLEVYPYDSEVHSLLGRSYGENGEEFKGYIHLAYASMYKRNFRHTDTMHTQAKKVAITQEEKELLKTFNKDYVDYKKLINN